MSQPIIDSLTRYDGYHVFYLVFAQQSGRFRLVCNMQIAPAQELCGACMLARTWPTVMPCPVLHHMA